MLCLGFPPAVYNAWNKCEILCFSASTNPQELFQAVLDIFYLYNDYDDQIKQMIIDDRSLNDFGALALEIFGTPSLAFGTFEKILFLAFDPDRPENRDYYSSYENEYFPEDEKASCTRIRSSNEPLT